LELPHFCLLFLLEQMQVFGASFELISLFLKL
jgi:hypothetical protein